MKAEIMNDCIALKSKMIEKQELEKQLRTKLSEYVQSNRKYAEGETVIVYSTDTKKEVARGIVASALTHITINEFFLNEIFAYKGMERRLAIRYEIFAIKKDGTKSTKHLFPFPHFIDENSQRGEYYIKK